MKKKFIQYVSVEGDNTGPWVDKFVSDKKITIEKVARYYERVHSFDWDSDGITFIGEPEAIKI